MMYIKRLITFILAFFCFHFANAQQTEDVVYLKNKWIIHGRIILRTDKQISIQAKDRNVFVFNIDEIDKITVEKIEPDLNIKTLGFAEFTELGPLAARNTSQLNVNTSAFSFQTVFGYKFNQWFFAGAGAGADLYATQTFFPVFGSIRGDLLSKRQFVPYYFFDAGYGINGTINNSNNLVNKGGALYAIGMGLKIGLSHNAGVLISAGYRVQQYQQSAGGVTEKDSYQRLALRAGFYL